MRIAVRQRSRDIFRLLGLAVTAAVLSLFSPATASAQSDDALKILKAMSDYMAGQKTIEATFDSNIEVLTSDLEKLQFASSGQLSLSRPDKLRVRRTGGYADVELVFDGQTATVFGRNLNAFAQVAAPGSTDQLLDKMREQLLLESPGADLLRTTLFDDLAKDVVVAKHIGQGVVNGIECEHLAFRNPDVDWQLWVEAGSNPIPRKYVITSKTVTGAPQYTLLIRDWKTDVKAEPEAFAFKPPADAKKVDFRALSDLDEVPAGVVPGGKQ
jgi:hypothetical protein